MISRIALRTKESVFCALLALSGCAAVGPNYTSPRLSEADVPAHWTSPTGRVGAAAERPDVPVQATQWWTELSDSALNQLVMKAFETSPTLEAAMAKLGQSRSQSAQTEASALPSADVSASSQRVSSDGVKNSYQDTWASTNSSWEIDLFGAVRRGKEGALAREEAQMATLADARVSLSADVTDAYLGYRACQSYLTLSEQDVVSRTATQKLTAASVEVGFTAPYQGIRSAASVAEAKARFTETKARCSRLENLLTRLTGVARPGLMEILAEEPTGLDRLPVPKHFDIAIPSRAVMQRPDIRAAERKLAAASADIGLAEADRYPRLTLNGALGYSVTGSSGSGSLSFGSWSFGPSLSLPIFDGGRREAAVKMTKSSYDEALATFKAKTRNAIQEIEDGLTRYAAAHERAENARVAAVQYQRFFAAVEERYREGANNLLELEDARRVMLDAQQTLLGVQQERLQAWIALNRATGGAAQYEAGSTSGQSAPLAKSSSPN